jgi:hypothetical protein
MNAGQSLVLTSHLMSGISTAVLDTFLAPPMVKGATPNGVTGIDLVEPLVPFKFLCELAPPTPTIPPKLPEANP